jgi:hypothetical protein
MMEAVRTSETSVDNHFTRQYNPEDSSEHHAFISVHVIGRLVGCGGGSLTSQNCDLYRPVVHLWVICDVYQG